MLDRIRALLSVAGVRLLAVALIAAAALVAVAHLASSPSGPGPAAATGHAPAGVPPIERLPARPEALVDQQLAPLTEIEARQRNAAVPFADLHPPPARPFTFTGSALDRARATDCLALAAMAEAGDSDAGQRAVIQVVLNRARHPAFARTICGAVFAGSERKTGCQFTFTCDGALRRTHSDDAWTAARRRAQEALDGRVYAPVGLATHYHTDWVYPYWSSELDKVARVETHLFFRWPGYWGSKQAMTGRYAGNEPAIAALATLASHATEPADGDAPGEGQGAGANAAGEVVVRHPGGRAFFVQLAAGASAESALSLGRELCPGDQPNCRVMGWIDRQAIPPGYPVPPASRAQLTFSYVREAGTEIVLYDCKHFPGTPRDNCIPPARRV
jgi:spore germination cell wall hydrolase CwlJ-like protein